MIFSVFWKKRIFGWSFKQKQNGSKILRTYFFSFFGKNVFSFGILNKNKMDLKNKFWNFMKRIAKCEMRFFGAGSSL